MRRRRRGRRRAQAGRRGTTRRTGHAPRSAADAPTIAPNPRHREGPVPVPTRVSGGEMPSRPTGAGGLARAVGLALGSRAVGGWSRAHPRRAAVVTQAVGMALGPRRPAAGVSMPPARGSQDGAERERPGLPQPGIPPRRSRTGQGWDNAVAASCCHPCKTAWSSTEDDGTHEAAQGAGCESSAVFSNRPRCHAAHGSRAPLAYEQALQTNEILCPEKC